MTFPFIISAREPPALVRAVLHTRHLTRVLALPKMVWMFPHLHLILRNLLI